MLVLNKGQRGQRGARAENQRNSSSGAKVREERMNGRAVASGVICAAALYLGLAVLTPSSLLGGICELVGIASGVVFVGLIDID
jgi:hypothetical protein